MPAVINARMKQSRARRLCGAQDIDRLCCHGSEPLIVAIPRLGCEPDGGVGGSIGTIAATLDDLEKESLGESPRIELEVLPSASRSYRMLSSRQLLDPLRIAARIAPPGRHNSCRGMGSVASPSSFRRCAVAKISVVASAMCCTPAPAKPCKKRAESVWLARRAVERDAQPALGRLDRLTLDQSQGIRHLHGGRLRKLEERRVVEQPRQHLLVVHRLRDVIHSQAGPRPMQPLPTTVIAWNSRSQISPLRSGLHQIEQAPTHAQQRRDRELGRARPVAVN